MIISGAYAIDKALTFVQEHIQKAEAHGTQDVQRVQNYLQAVHEAIVGLESEYDEILVQASHCQLDQADQARALGARIDNYLTVDRLRSELMRAVAGLRACRIELQKNADRFLQWPWGKKKDRQAAVADFADLLEQLEGYIESLETEGLAYRLAGTGVAVAPLMEIKRYLEPGQNLSVSDQRDFLEVVRYHQEDRTKDNLLGFTKQIQSILDQLISSFR